MNFDFDYRKFQEESQNRLQEIFKESLYDLENNPDENREIDETYCKIRKILDCPEMEKSHPFLYSLDMENVNEDDKKKIDDLYACGVDRGVIQEEEKDEEGEVPPEECGECDDGAVCGGPEDSIGTQELQNNPVPPAPETQEKFTVLYSAVKNGEVKTGECYSQAENTLGAKEDAINKLTMAGYTAINVLAVEQNQFGVEAGVTDMDADAEQVKYYMDEGDEEEFEKQETGDTSSEAPEDKKDEKVEENPSDAEEKEPAEDKSEDKPEDDVKDDSEDKEDDKAKDEPEDKQEEPVEKDQEEDEEKDSDDEKKDDSEKKLDGAQKNALKNEYEKVFKEVLKKTGMEKSVEEMSLSERTDFYSKLAERWTKNDPSEFMSDKDQEKLNKAVVKDDEEAK